MNLLLAIPLEIRLLVLFLLGAVLGSFLNLAIYRWAWRKRSISPWSEADRQAPPRKPSDRIPIVGWLGLRREAKLHGRGFWVRPLLIELALAVGLPWLYWWEVVQAGLCPGLAYLPSEVMLPASVLHLQFFSHTVLIALMTVATFIDIDDRIIPDEVTVPGTLLGLFLAAALPWSLLPELAVQPVVPDPALAIPLELPAELAERIHPDRLYLHFVTLVSPQLWHETLGTWPPLASLALGVGCYWLWIFAVLPRPWRVRHGLRRALAIASTRMFRALLTPLVLTIWLVGTAAIVGVWLWGGAHWAGLLTALVGLVGSGGIVWAVRIIGALTLRKEAMGFGDVLLMMMIGTFMGWQAGLLIFFMAPFAGLVIGLLNLFIRRDQTIPYGPFLCLAALVTLVGWAGIWEWAEPIFGIGWLMPAVIVACMGVMTIMLFMLRVGREALFPERA